MTERPFLTPKHQQTLTDSGIAADIAAERPYRSVTAADPRLDPFADYQRADGILIAVRPPDGTNGRYQLRHDRDRVRADGSTAKYEQPAGGEHRLDVHPRFHDKLSDPSVHAWVGEGIKKGDALATRGELCVSLGGVDCALTPACLEDWQHIAIEGRTFIICFDYDPKPVTRQNVVRARDKLARFLTERGGRVRVVDLPPGTNGEKQGIDDYLAAGGSLVELLAQHTTDWRPGAEGDCPRDDCRATREQLRLQTRILTEPGVRPNRRLPYYALVHRVQSDATRARHPEAEPGKPETWKAETPLADRQGFIGINLQGMAKDTGVSYATLLKARSELIELGVLEAREESSVIPNPKDPDRHIEITRTLVRPAAASPREMVQKLVTVVQAPSGWGGKRVWRCPDCRDAKIEIKRVCADCGKDAVQVEIAPDSTCFQLENRPVFSSLPPRTSSDQLENWSSGGAPDAPPAGVLLVGAQHPDPDRQRQLQREARAEIDVLVERRTATSFQVENRPTEADVGFDPPADGSRSPWPTQFLMLGAGMRWQSYVVCGFHIRQGQKHWEAFAQQHADALPRVVEEMRRLRAVGKGLGL